MRGAPGGYAACNAKVIARARVNLLVTGANNYADLAGIDPNGGIKYKLLARPCTNEGPSGEVIDVVGEERAIVKNACALRGVGTSSAREVCYGANGEVLSSVPPTP